MSDLNILAAGAKMSPLPKPVDLTSEMYRLYTYPDGSKFRIEMPNALYVLSEDNHRVVDSEGLTHRPTRGWVGISWKPAPGAPAFVV